MSKNIYFSQLFLLFLLLFTSSCSDSKPEKLFIGFRDDFNATSIDLNRELQITVYAEFDDATQESVTDEMLWSSSDTTIATVSNGLVATTSKSGSVQISYKTKDIAKGDIAYFEKTYNVNVKALELLKIELSESSIVLYEGGTHLLHATGTFEDNSSSEISYQDITNDCSWVSADSNISSVDTLLNKGLVTARNIGITTITASNLGQSASSIVEVKEIEYTKIEIDTNETIFNVEQSITLEASAFTNDGKKVYLDAEELEWSSSDDEIVSVTGNRAIAKKAGEVTIKALYKEDITLSDTISLEVDKEEYVRIFKNGIEVEFPFAQSSEYTTLPVLLDTFTLRAVGKDFHVQNLLVKDFNITIIDSNEAYFDGVSNGETIYEDVNLTYTLVHSATQKELHYYYTIDDTFSNSFSQKYKELD